MRMSWKILIKFKKKCLVFTILEINLNEINICVKQSNLKENIKKKEKVCS